MANSAMTSASDITGDTHVVKLVGQDETARWHRLPTIEQEPRGRSHPADDAARTKLEDIADPGDRGRGVGLERPCSNSNSSKPAFLPRTTPSASLVLRSQLKLLPACPITQAHSVESCRRHRLALRFGGSNRRRRHKDRRRAYNLDHLWVDGRNPERQKHPTFPATEREMCTLALARRALSGRQGNEIGSVAPITYEFFYLGRQA